jgi:Flp pilus assembly secretin CpaC/tetratricopeptide (TPR) repeat protein
MHSNRVHLGLILGAALATSACQSADGGVEDQTSSADVTEASDNSGSAAAVAAIAENQEQVGTESASAPAPGATGQDGGLDQETRKALLKSQAQAAQVAEYLALADSAESNQQFDRALSYLERALALDGDNPVVLQNYNRVAALLGVPGADSAQLLVDDVQRAELRERQLLADAEDKLRRARMMIDRGDYAKAAAEADLALTTVKYAESFVDWGNVEERAEALLAEATQAGEERAEADRLSAQREAAEQLREQEARVRAQEEARVARKLEQAIAAFELQSYDAAMEFSEQVLEMDPRNEMARDIRDTSFEAGREKASENFLRKKQNRFKQWRQELLEQRIPFVDLLTVDADNWNQLTEMRAGRGVLGAAVDETNAEDLSVYAQLRETRIPNLVVDEVESLTEVVSQIQLVSGIDMVVDQAAEEAAYDEAVLFTFNLKNSTTVENALDLIADAAGENVTWTVKYGAVLLTTREKARGELEMVPHDISDLTINLPNFLAPRLDKLRLLDELEDDDGGGPFGSYAEASTQLEQDRLVELIQRNVSPSSWEEEGVSINAYNDTTLVVRHTRAIQLEVQRFLEELRNFNSMMVTIDTKFLTVSDNFLQQIGVDWRGIDNPAAPFTDLDDVTNGGEDDASLGFDNGGSGNANGNAAGNPSSGFFYDDGPDGDFKGTTQNFFENPLGEALSAVGGLTAQLQILDDANLSFIFQLVEKTSQIELVNSQQLTVYNSQQAAVSVINQQAYVQDFDVEVATFITIADPVINVLSEGVSLQVTPTVHHDRQALNLEVQPTVARVVGLTPFSTSLANGGAPVEFTLPELEIQALKTTAVIPDGGTILIGGLNRIRNTERRAEVPWLANIPIAGFFFKQEGYSDENSSLMILMQAWITDVREEVAKLEY